MICYWQSLRPLSYFVWFFFFSSCSFLNSAFTIPAPLPIKFLDQIGSRLGAATATAAEKDPPISTSPSPLPMAATWCPDRQIYVGGVLPDNERVRELLRSDDGLRVFGYGSLCWNPGTGPLAHRDVTSAPGKARGYKRCWAQKSTDHRGTTAFPGIVCTLITDEEYRSIAGTDATQERETLTEGVVYRVPPHLAEECLAELDFREKGGYARDVIDVVQDGEVHQALLYRGTPDNPAFWKRALLDLPFAAAIMAVASGPSGDNGVYLSRLDDFLSESGANVSENDIDSDDTSALAELTRKFTGECNLHFLFGSGSNQHEQLLLRTPASRAAASLVKGEDAHEMTELLLCTQRVGNGERERIADVYVGGGHAGMLSEDGRLYLWGWNEDGQLGRTTVQGNDASLVLPFSEDIRVFKASLGFTHTMVIESGTGRLYCFGSDHRGQVTGGGGSEGDSISAPTTPSLLQADRFVDVSAGVFHSAAVTADGELVTFGCGRFNQSLSSKGVGRWRPPRETDDSNGVRSNSKVVKVACGKRHTVVLDDRGRLWTFGENKYGQLGDRGSVKSTTAMPQRVEAIPVVPEGSSCSISCGWSHTVVTLCDAAGVTTVYGWGRNDKGQLGMKDQKDHILTPTILFSNLVVQDVACGSESTHIVEENGTVHGCGWNEHGNLATGTDQDALTLTTAIGARVVSPYDGDTRVQIAAGGAEVLCVKIPQYDSNIRVNNL